MDSRSALAMSQALSAINFGHKPTQKRRRKGIHSGSILSRRSWGGACGMPGKGKLEHPDPCGVAAGWLREAAARGTSYQGHCPGFIFLVS